MDRLLADIDQVVPELAGPLATDVGPSDAGAGPPTTSSGMEVVTADGAAGARERRGERGPLLGLRGGGGNFGVVTGIEYALHPVGPEIVGGIVAWPASEAPQVLELYRTLAESAPPELTLVALLRPAPPAPWLPKERTGQPIVGDPRLSQRRSRGGRAGGRADQVVRQARSATCWCAGRTRSCRPCSTRTQPKGRRYYWKSEYLPRIEPALCEQVIEHAARIRSPHSAVILFQIGGALNRLAADHSPVGNRDARFVLNIAGSWERPTTTQANVEWARAAWSDMRAFSTGGTYVNFLTADEVPSASDAALGDGLRRLAEVKATWDPHNVFRTNRD